MTPYVDVIDVGHGSSVLIRSEAVSTLVDTGPGIQVLEYLTSEGITSLVNVIISHADADHISGLIRLLDAGFPIERVYLNADALKGSAEWASLRFSLEDRQVSGELTTHASMSGGMAIDCGDSLQLRVIAPLLGDVLAGAGGESSSGREFTSNSMSVVLRLMSGERGLMLLPGDLDAVGLEAMMRRASDITARVLVAPHHGGLMGTPKITRDSIEALCLAVGPEVLVVSNGRGRYGNPRDVVIEAARKNYPDIYIACTQLSERCSAVVSSAVRPGLGSSYSAGVKTNFCCAGTMRFVFEESELFVEHEVHRAFVDLVPLAQCRLVRPELTILGDGSSGSE